MKPCLHIVDITAGDLPLFQVNPQISGSTRPSAVEAALAALTPDDLSPREALENIYRLKKIADET